MRFIAAHHCQSVCQWIFFILTITWGSGCIIRWWRGVVEFSLQASYTSVYSCSTCYCTATISTQRLSLSIFVPNFGLKQLRTFFKASHAETGSYGVAFHTSASSFRGYLRLLNVMGTLKSFCVDAYNTFSQWATRQLCSFFNSLAGIVERRLLLLKQWVIYLNEGFK